MLALTVRPGVPGSGALSDVPEPNPADGSVLVATLAVGVCGTDREILAVLAGEAPPGSDRLALGHESLGTVLDAPAGSGLAEGDRVVGIVRRPDPEPCPNCAVGEFDMCRNGLYVEHGIKGRDGFARARWRAEPKALVRVDGALGDAGVLLEPTSVVAKAWEHVEHIGARARWAPERVLVTGAGPIGLLAALLGVQRGYEVHVLDRVTSGPKPDLVAALGATYTTESPDELALRADIVLECTGVPAVIGAVVQRTGRNGIVCLTGVSTPGRRVPLDLGAVNREWVLENDVVFGSVNANRRHYEAGADALAGADREWLSRLITSRTPVEDFARAVDSGPDDIKVVLTF
jgi:threonine dehydrogenase-like Zn-dependent dehydrogenase